MIQPAHPVAAGMAVSGAVLAWINIASNTDLLGKTFQGDLIGIAAALYTVLLVTGWALHRTRLLAWGLLLAWGVWVSRAVFVIVSDGWDHYGVCLSLGWAIIAGGSYWLERTDPGRRNVRSE